jgi:hypothetical protein
MIFFLVFLSVLALSLKLDDIHEVIIIGAGIAGIGACRKLTELKIPHLIL